MPGIGEKPIWVIVDETGKTINRNPSRDKLKGLEKEPRKPRDTRKWKMYPDEELLNELRLFEMEYGRIPIEKDFTNNPEYPSFVTYQKRFGSWNKALEKAFDIKRDKCEYAREQYTDEELLNELRRFEKEYGRIPTEKDFVNNPEYPGFMTYIVRFGSWNNVLEKVFDIKRKKYGSEKYTDEDLLNELRLFEKENGRPPTEKDFTNNVTYQRRFGSWPDALSRAGLYIDLMGKQCDSYRARQAEITILNYLENKPIDLSGKNWHSYCDAIDPNDGPYDVKSSKLHNNTYYSFITENEDKDDDKDAIQWYYFLAINDDGTIRYVWRVPGEIVENSSFHVGTNNRSRAKFIIDNMKEYDITENFKLVQTIYDEEVNDENYNTCRRKGTQIQF